MTYKKNRGLDVKWVDELSLFLYTEPEVQPPLFCEKCRRAGGELLGNCTTEREVVLIFTVHLRLVKAALDDPACLGHASPSERFSLDAPDARLSNHDVTIGARESEGKKEGAECVCESGKGSRVC